MVSRMTFVLILVIVNMYYALTLSVIAKHWASYFAAPDVPLSIVDIIMVIVVIVDEENETQ